ILAQRISLPVLGHHDADEVRVAVEADSEEIKDLALEIVARGEDGEDGIDLGVVAQQLHFETYSLFPRHGKHVVAELETGLGGIPVHAGDVGQEREAELGIFFQGADGRDNVLARNPDAELVAVELHAFHGDHGRGQQFGQRRTVLELFNVGNGRLEGHLDPFPRQFLVPVEHALLPYIEEAGQDDGHVHQHLPEAEHLEFAEDDGPRVHEDGFYIEQDKEDSDEVELYREA